MVPVVIWMHMLTIGIQISKLDLIPSYHIRVEVPIMYNNQLQQDSIVKFFVEVAIQPE